MKRGNFVGAPAFYELNHACTILRDAFAATPYLVGSAIERRDHRDVDVRLMLGDDEYARAFPNGGGTHDPMWSLLVMSISAWLAKQTGLAIDFQIQRRSQANEEHGGRPRQPLGMFYARPDV